VAAGAGLVAMLVGAEHLVAWLAGDLSRSGLTSITMKTNTALCLTLAGAALFLLTPPQTTWARRWSARALAAVALAVGVLTFVENFAGWDFGIDELLAVEAPGAMAVASPNRMGLPASLGFVLAGLALLILSRRDHRRVRVAQALALAICLVSLLAIIGFLYGAQELYGIARHTGIAWPTAASLLLLGLGLLCVRPTEGLMALVTADDPGGISLRRLLPAAIILPVLLGWLRLAGERAGVFDAPMGTAMVMVSFIVIFSALAYHVSRQASRSARALREKEERLRAIFDNAGVGLAEVARDDCIVAANDRLCEILGYERQELLGKKIHDLTAPEDWTTSDALNARLHEGLVDRIDYEKRYLHRDGSPVWVHVTMSPIHDAQGRWLRSIGTIEDISERRSAEEALRESHARLKKVLEVETVGVMFWDLATGFMTDANDTFLKMMGYSRGDVEARELTWQKLTPPEYVDVSLVEIAKFQATGRVGPYEKEYFCKDGTRRWLLFAGSSLGGDACVEFCVDITERKRAEEALRESEKRLRLAADGGRFGVFEWDVRADVPIWDNERMYEIFGLAPGDEPIKGEQFTREVIHPDDLPRFESELAESMRSGGVFNGAYRIRRRNDGKWRWIEYFGRFEFSPEGEPIRLVSLLNDVTERKQAEESLRDLNATLESKVAQRTAELERRARQLQKLTLELSQAEEQERRRIAVILHEDLQQQIAAAKFQLSLVRGRTRDSVLLPQIERVDETLTGALERSRGLSHDLSPAVVHMKDLNEVLHWLVKRVRDQHGLNVNVETSGDMILHSESLSLFLFRAVQELLFNVVKHARVDAAAIRVRRVGRYISLCVSDRGRGFDLEELRDTSGVGLFSFRERTELLGGRMNVKSGIGRGSRFRITVPDGPATKSRNMKTEIEEIDEIQAQTSVAVLPVSDRRVRVLLVDDHDMVREGLAALLQESPDIEVIGEAADGREAIDMTNDLRPDVVVMDVSMPLMSGDQATRLIKMHMPEIRVIALSMFDEAEKKERMYQAGAESYVLKTATADELLAAIQGKD